MRVETASIDVSKLELNKEITQNLSDINVDVEAEIAKATDMSADEIEHEINLDTFHTVFTTVIHEKESLLQSKEDQVAAEQIRKEIEELKNMCKELSIAISEADYQELEGKQVEPSKITLFHLKSLLGVQQNEITTVASENTEKLNTALLLSKEVTKMSEEQIYSLVKREVEPTIENIYKEVHIPSSKNKSARITLDKEIWEELKPRAEEIISSSGIKADEQSFEITKKLIEREIPVTKENLNKVIKLTKLKTNYNENTVKEAVTRTIQKGKNVLSTNLTINQTEESKKIVEAVLNITEDAVIEACKDEKPITIKHLKQAEEQVKKASYKENREHIGENGYETNRVYNTNTREYESNPSLEVERDIYGLQKQSKSEQEMWQIEKHEVAKYETKKYEARNYEVKNYEAKNYEAKNYEFESYDTSKQIAQPDELHEREDSQRKNITRDTQSGEVSQRETKSGDTYRGEMIQSEERPREAHLNGMHKDEVRKGEVKRSENNYGKENHDESRHSELVSNDTKLSEIKSSEIKSSDIKSSEIKSSDTKSSDIKSSEIKSSDIKSSDTKSSDIKLSEIKSSDIKSSDTKSSEIKSSDTKSSEIKPSDTKPSDTKPSDTKSCEIKSSDIKPSDIKSSDTKTSEIKPSDTKASEIKSSDIKLSEIKSSDTKTSDTKPSDIKASEIKSSDTKPNDIRQNDAKESNKSSDTKSIDIMSREKNPFDTRQDTVEQSRIVQQEVEQRHAESSDIETGSNNVREITKKEIEQENLELRETTVRKEEKKEKEQFEAQNNETKQVISQYEQLSKREIVAKRQLEEIRLKLTLEASNKLMAKGIDIETKELSKVVEELRLLEREDFKMILKSAELPVTGENLSVMEQTSNTMMELSSAPIYLLGQTLRTVKMETIISLNNKGTALRMDLQRANVAYETMLTVPNPVYRDSIQKAFSNMDPLLEELGIEKTEENVRAVKILSYNEMELSKDNIEEIKLYDKKLNYLLNNLKPFVTVELIKENINPLSMPIDELNGKVTEIIQGMQNTKNESFSKFLYRLEQRDEISKEDREAYIGVYRLLEQIEQTDGKALGRVVKAGQDITLKNMLIALRSTKKEQKEYVVNEEKGFSYLEGDNKKDIGKQIERGFEQSQISDYKEDVKELLKQIEVLPTIHHKLTQTQQDKTPGKASNLSLWNQMKDIPIDQLLKEFDELIHDNKGQIYENEKHQLKDILKNADTSVSFLHRLQEPCSPENMMYVNQMFGQQDSIYNKTKKGKSETAKENLSVILKKMNQLTDKLVSKVEMQAEYAGLQSEVSSMLNHILSEKEQDFDTIRMLSSIQSQLAFTKRLSNKESYFIPIETEHSVANMNLTIFRNTKDKGKLMISVNSEETGNIRVNMRLNKGMLTGLIESDNRGLLQDLAQSKSSIKNLMEKEKIEVKQISYSFEPHLIQKEAIGYTGRNESNLQDERSEQLLYRLAKLMVKDIAKACKKVA